MAADIFEITVYLPLIPLDEDRGFTTPASTVNVSDDGRLLIKNAAGRVWDMGPGTWGGYKVILLTP